jgi:hypothetical protein
MKAVDKADELAFQLKAAGIGGWEREFRFHGERRWRCDLAFPARRLAIECEGGLYISGRHSRGAGAEADLEKYAELAIAGWRLIRVSPRQIRNGMALAWIERALAPLGGLEPQSDVGQGQGPL